MGYLLELARSVVPDRPPEVSQILPSEEALLRLVLEVFPDAEILGPDDTTGRPTEGESRRGRHPRNRAAGTVTGFNSGLGREATPVAPSATHRLSRTR